MQGKVVAAAAQVLERAHALDVLRQRPCVLDRDEGIVAVDIHTQVDEGVCHLGAHVAQANYANALALELAANKGLLGLFSIRENVGIVRVGAPSSRTAPRRGWTGSSWRAPAL